jgi:Protein of unknown function (DUF3276)
VEGYRDQREVYSNKVRAGKRTYIFDVRATRGNDFYITITERKRNGEDMVKQKLFLYKEDFNKFMAALDDTVGYVKEELLPDYDFDQHDSEFNNDDGYDGPANGHDASQQPQGN